MSLSGIDLSSDIYWFQTIGILTNTGYIRIHMGILQIHLEV